MVAICWRWHSLGKDQGTRVNLKVRRLIRGIARIPIGGPLRQTVIRLRTINFKSAYSTKRLWEWALGSCAKY